MKKHILLGTSLLLTVCSAVAGTFIYGQGSRATVDSYTPASVVAEEQPSPMTIEMWKATATSSDYMAPKAPI
jgi:hypothetical protein